MEDRLTHLSVRLDEFARAFDGVCERIDQLSEAERRDEIERMLGGREFLNTLQ